MIVVEVLDQRGAPSARARLTQFPATIGRALDCDVSLDDPYVCPVHFRVVEGPEGELRAEDAGSVNGICLVGMDVRIPHVPLGVDTRVRAGRTTLRFRDATAPVAPAIAERADPHGFTAGLGMTQVSLGACAMALVAFVVVSYTHEYERPSVASAVGSSVAALVGLGAWAAVWAFVGRAVSHRFQFLRHLALASIAATAAILVGQAGQWLEFVAPASAASAFVYAVGFLGIVTATIAAHLGVAAGMPAGRRFGWAAGVTVGAAALVGLMTYADHDKFTNALDDPGTLKSYGAGWVRAEPAAEFATHVSDLQRKVDSLARARDDR
jgi:hypothetical protein